MWTINGKKTSLAWHWCDYIGTYLWDDQDFLSVNSLTSYVCICNLLLLLLPFVSDLVFLFSLVLHSFSIQFYLPAEPPHTSTPTSITSITTHHSLHQSLKPSFASRSPPNSLAKYWLTLTVHRGWYDPGRARKNVVDMDQDACRHDFSITPCYGMCCLSYHYIYTHLFRNACVCAGCPVKFNSQGLCCWNVDFCWFGSIAGTHTTRLPHTKNAHNHGTSHRLLRPTHWTLRSHHGSASSLVLSAT